MVTKLYPLEHTYVLSLILAKNHMVTKRPLNFKPDHLCLILAKNHMVTKLVFGSCVAFQSLILAKNHMVTKQTLINEV